MALGALLTWAAPAHADCVPRSHLSTCIDADTLWPHPGPAYFGFVGGTDTTAPGQVGFGVVTTYASRPITLMVPTTQPNGTEVAAVDDLWDATFLFSLGLTDRLEVDAALPMTLGRSGSAYRCSPRRHQQPCRAPRCAMPVWVPRSAWRRGHATFRVTPSGSPHDSSWRCPPETRRRLPAIDRWSAFRASRPTFAHGAFMAASELGARLRQASDLVGSRVGSQIVFAFGVGAQLLDADRLSLHLEAMALPTLIGQHELDFDLDTGKRFATASRPPLVPAEWQLSIRSAELMNGDLSASLGFGTAIGIGDSAITAPSARAIFAIRYAPLGRTKATEAP